MNPTTKTALTALVAFGIGDFYGRSASLARIKAKIAPSKGIDYAGNVAVQEWLKDRTDHRTAAELEFDIRTGNKVNR